MPTGTFEWGASPIGWIQLSTPQTGGLRADYPSVGEFPLSERSQSALSSNQPLSADEGASSPTSASDRISAPNNSTDVDLQPPLCAVIQQPEVLVGHV